MRYCNFIYMSTKVSQVLTVRDEPNTITRFYTEKFII